jgi:hypothetical protein
MSNVREMRIFSAE